MSEPLQGTVSAANAIARVKYTHDALIDLIIADPAIKQKDLAAHFGYTQPWLSRVMNSDAFQARLAIRKADIIDPALTLSIEEKLKALASKALDVVLDNLSAAPSAANGLRALEVTTKALGYGARQQNLNVQQNFVVAMPQKAATATEWLEAVEEGQTESGVNALPASPAQSSSPLARARAAHDVEVREVHAPADATHVGLAPA